MLSNAYFLAKFRFDTAENEPAKNLQNFATFPNFALSPKVWGPAGAGRGRAGASRPPQTLHSSLALTRLGQATRRVVANFSQNFGKMLLVFGCIGPDFCKKIRVLQHFSKSTRFSS